MKRYVVYVTNNTGDYSYVTAFDRYVDAKSCFENRLSTRSGYIGIDKDNVIVKVLKRYERK